MEKDRFLEQLAKESKGGEMVLVVLRTVGDLTMCHGFGARSKPTEEISDVFGILKNPDELLKSLQESSFHNVEIKGMFEKCAVSDKYGEILVMNEENKYKFPSPIFSEKSVFYVKRVADAKELKSDELQKWSEFHSKVHSGIDLPSIFRMTGEVLDNEFLSMVRNTQLTAYLGKDAIIEYLMQSKQPLALAKAFISIGVPVPEKLSNEAKREAQRDVRKLYAEVSKAMGGEEATQARLSELRRASESSGVIVEGGAASVVEDEDDIKVMTLWARKELSEEFEGLGERAKKMKEEGIPQMVAEVEVFPGVEIKVEKFLASVEQTLGVKEERRRAV